MAQAGSPQGLRLPVSGRGQGSGMFSVGEAKASSRKSIPVGRSFPTRPSFFSTKLSGGQEFVAQPKGL